MKRFNLLSLPFVGGLFLASSVAFAAPRTTAADQFDGDFGSMVRFSDTIVPQWRGFVNRRGAVSGAWSSFVNALRTDDGHSLIDRVNSAVNQLPYVPDSQLGRPVNYWAAPSEFLARGGDCKDYALAKYMALRALGIPANSMRILVLPDHAVLVVNSGEGAMVLDNLRSSPYPLSDGLLSQAIYAVNDTGAWINVIPN